MPSWTRMEASTNVVNDEMLQKVDNKTRESKLAASSIAVPEIYDLESMRWMLEAIFQGLEEVEGLILDLRFNQGGGSHLTALTIASFFANENKATLAFSTDEKVPGPGPRFSKKKHYYIPHTSRCKHYHGPLAVLQSQYTRGTAELLLLSLMKRPFTCRIGASTAGSMSPLRQVRLPNYWNVEIPHQRIFSGENELLEGVGISPNEKVTEMENFANETVNENSLKNQSTNVTFDPCVKKAIDYIMDVEHKVT